MTIRLSYLMIAVTMLTFSVGHMSSYAQSVPRVLQYEGRLLMDGSPAIGAYDVTFSLFTTPQGGEPVWSEEHEITPDDGLFSVLLGSENPLPESVPNEHDTLYLSMQVNNDPPMTPRLFMAGTMYSLRAGLADGVRAESIGTDALADGGVTAAKLAADAAVTNVNGQSGALTLAAGSNVNIEEDEGTFTISASGGIIGGGDITAVAAGDGLTGGGEAGDVTLALEDAGVTSEKLADVSVTTEKLVDASVTTAKLASDAAVNSLNGQRGDLSIVAGDNVEIAEEDDGTFTISSTNGGGQGDITAVGAGEGLAGGGQFGAVELSLADGGVTTDKLDDDAVTGSKLANGAVDTNELTDGAVTSAKLANGSVGTPDLADEAVTTNKLSDDAVTGAKLAPNAAVTSLNNLQNGITLEGGGAVDVTENANTITISAPEGGGGDITAVNAGNGLGGGGASGSVTLDIASNGVTSGMLANEAVNENKLADDAVTSDKLAPNTAVTSLNGLQNNISVEGGGAVTVSESGGTITIDAPEGGEGDITGVMAESGLSGGGSTGEVTLGIADNGVGTDMLADGAVTSDKLATDAAVTDLNGSTGGIDLQGAGSITIDPSGQTITISDEGGEPSSRRWKTNIRTIRDPLDVVTKLRGVSFDWTEDGRPDIGVIAEEVGAVLPEIVEFEDNGTDAKSVKYSRLVSVLIEAVKAQQQQLEERDAVIDQITSRLDQLERLAQQSSHSGSTTTSGTDGH